MWRRRAGQAGAGGLADGPRIDKTPRWTVLTATGPPPVCIANHIPACPPFACVSPSLPHLLSHLCAPFFILGCRLISSSAPPPCAFSLPRSYPSRSCPSRSPFLPLSLSQLGHETLIPSFPGKPAHSNGISTYFTHRGPHQSLCPSCCHPTFLDAAAPACATWQSSPIPTQP